MSKILIPEEVHDIRQYNSDGFTVKTVKATNQPN